MQACIILQWRTCLSVHYFNAKSRKIRTNRETLSGEVVKRSLHVGARRQRKNTLGEVIKLIQLIYMYLRQGLKPQPIKQPFAVYRRKLTPLQLMTFENVMVKGVIADFWM